MKDLLLVADVSSWAFQFTADGMSKYMDFDVMYSSDDPRVTKEIVSQYKKTHFFNWLCGQECAGMPGVTAGVCQFNHRLRWPDIAPKYIGRFEKIVAISREIEEDVKQLNPNTTYIPNAVCEKTFKPCPHEGDYTVGWVSQKTTGGFGEEKTNEGRKRWDIKGYQLLLEPLMKRLEGKVKFKICSNDYTNAIPHSEMPGWYADIDCLICTSLYEGGPFSVLEAASCAKPIISTNVGIVPELITSNHNGYLCGKVRSKDDISHTLDLMEVYILKLRDNRDLCNKMGELARDAILKEWTWEKVTPLWKQFFEGGS